MKMTAANTAAAAFASAFEALRDALFALTPEHCTSNEIRVSPPATLENRSESTLALRWVGGPNMG